MLCDQVNKTMKMERCYDSPHNHNINESIATTVKMITE